jgi:uncharacterized protein YqgC (DUF456 family)
MSIVQTHIRPRNLRQVGRGRALSPDLPRRNIGLWIPVTPLAILLAPLALIAMPFAELAFARRRYSPWRAMLAIGVLLTAMSGTVIEVETPRARIGIRIF